jgi:methanogenic corrinoid protein MtbC1
MTDQFSNLISAILAGDSQAGVADALRLIEGGLAPLEIFTQCIEPTLAEVGQKFSRLEIFLPEMMNSADVVKAVQAAVKPHMAGGESTGKGRIVIGTVAGDLHDIGKNIVRSMLEVNGFEVKDLGVDVDPFDMVAAAKDFEANVIAMSALMLPSLPFARDTIEILKADEVIVEKVKTMIGGGPVSEDWVIEAGGDAYGDDAIEAVAVAKRLVGTA